MRLGVMLLACGGIAVAEPAWEEHAAALRQEVRAIGVAGVPGPLCILGDDAFPTLLNKLAHKSNDTLLREGARHVIHYNRSATVRAESGELMRALKGPGADIASMEAAYKLSKQWK